MTRISSTPSDSAVEASRPQPDDRASSSESLRTETAASVAGSKSAPLLERAESCLAHESLSIERRRRPCCECGEGLRWEVAAQERRDVHPGDARIEVHRVAGRPGRRCSSPWSCGSRPRRRGRTPPCGRREHRDGNAGSRRRAVEAPFRRSSSGSRSAPRERAGAARALRRTIPGWGGPPSIRSRARLPTTATRRIGAAYRVPARPSEVGVLAHAHGQYRTRRRQLRVGRWASPTEGLVTTTRTVPVSLGWSSRRTRARNARGLPSTKLGFEEWSPHWRDVIAHPDVEAVSITARTVSTGTWRSQLRPKQAPVDREAGRPRSSRDRRDRRSSPAGGGARSSASTTGTLTAVQHARRLIESGALGVLDPSARSGSGPTPPTLEALSPGASGGTKPDWASSATSARTRSISPSSYRADRGRHGQNGDDRLRAAAADRRRHLAVVEAGELRSRERRRRLEHRPLRAWDTGTIEASRVALGPQARYAFEARREAAQWRGTSSG